MRASAMLRIFPPGAEICLARDSGVWAAVNFFTGTYAAANFSRMVAKLGMLVSDGVVPPAKFATRLGSSGAPWSIPLFR